MTPLTITLYAHGRDARPLDTATFNGPEEWPDVVATFEELLQREAPSKLELYAWAPHTLRAGQTRSKAAVREVTAVVLDLDACSVAQVIEYLGPEGLNLRAIVMASPSDTNGTRVRVVVPASRPMRTAAEVRHTRLALAELLGYGPGCGVEGALDASRIFFIGRLEGTPPRSCWAWSEGNAIDVDALMAYKLEHDWRQGTAPAPGPAKTGSLQTILESPVVPNAAPEPADLEALEAALDVAANAEPSIEYHGGDAALFRAASAVARAAKGDAAITEFALLEVFNPLCVPPWNAAKIKREALAAAARENTPEAKLARRRADAPIVEAPRAPTHIPGVYNPVAVLDLDLSRQGVPKATALNTGRVIEHVFAADAIRYEEAAGRIVVKGIDPALGHFPEGEWSDTHTTSLIELCEKLDIAIGASVVDRAVDLHAKKHAFNAMSDGLMAAALAWDGVPRVEKFFATYWGANDDAASAAVSRVFLLSLAARGLEPGIKVDTCPIIIGSQGTGKSTGLRTLVGDNFFSDSPIQMGDKDAAQAIQGKLLWEIQEHASISSREAAVVKAFLSQSSDRYRASYGRHTRDVLRTCTFVSTTNEHHNILKDPTGARRFLPVHTRTVNVKAIARDRIQLLGEAAMRVLQGEAYHPSDAETATLASIREDLADDGAHDAWSDLIQTWAAKRAAKKGATPASAGFTMGELFNAISGAIPTAESHQDLKLQRRAGRVLRDLGYKPSLVGIDRRRVWVRASVV